ncbi:SRPBCC family protein [Microbacterium sp. A93]|uniref:SRPBCC family protein n=1 Tax=Microbacterium sp. A93 TaxID=3450716 RepID=UPI003F438F8B
MTSTFTVETISFHPVERLFEVSLNIDEHLGSMADSGERAIGGVTTGAIQLGETVTWRARHFGVWFTMTSQITEHEWPRRFVDEQIAGPFRSFRHVHEYRTVGRTAVMTDTITLASPVFGRLAEKLVLVPYLRRLIRQRNRHLLAVLDAHG